MYILIIGLVFLVAFSYVIGKQDFLNPIFMACATFLMSAASAIYLIKPWAIELSAATISLILCSLLFFAVAGWIARITSSTKRNASKVKFELIYIGRAGCFVVLLIGFFVGYIYIRNIFLIAIRHGYSSGSGVNALMKIYRYATHFSEMDAENRMPAYAVYLMDFFTSLSYIMTYVLINNLCCKNNKRQKQKYIRYIIIIILYVLISLLTGARFRILKLSVFIFVVVFMIKKKQERWNYKLKPRLIVKIVVAACAVLTLFVLMRTFVGRENETSPIYNLATYMGGSIGNLDLFIRSPISKSNIWGKETFYSFYNFLYRRTGNPEWNYLFAKEFRYSNGVSTGNVYTALRCFYYDFGFLGCVLIMAVLGFLVTKLYLSIRNRNINANIDMGIIFYGYYFHSIFFLCINAYFDYLTPGIIREILFFIIAKRFILYINKLFSKKVERGMINNCDG